MPNQAKGSINSLRKIDFSSVSQKPLVMTNVVSKDAQPSIDYLASAFKRPEFDARIAETKYDFSIPSQVRKIVKL